MAMKDRLKTNDELTVFGTNDFDRYVQYSTLMRFKFVTISMIRKVSALVTTSLNTHASVKYEVQVI